MGRDDIDVALIQEPWISGNRVRGLRSRNLILLSPQTEGRIRSCIVARRDLHLTLISRYSDEDLTVVSMERPNKPVLVLASMYLPYDEDDPPSSKLRALVKWCETKGHDLILGGDANAHHSLWGSTDINNRGESLFNYLLSTNLVICNKGNRPTFYNRIREQVIDITLVTNSDSIKVSNWRVSDECSFSDHNRILFTIEHSVGRGKPYRNPKKTNWDKFRSLVQSLPPPQGV